MQIILILRSIRTFAIKNLSEPVKVNEKVSQALMNA